ncbi:hypothetical protein [Amycolatopsis nigrescens]|uniref:hypothetical protein n=1 Tax=Amycolatopsis nigrescens TaxID=381445 RepID=UPI001B7FA130|nr:hypothetical protein [Amycolatopsis nigrescens]
MGGPQGRHAVASARRAVELPGQSVSGDGRTLTARATTTIDRYAFGVTAAKGMTGRRLHLTIEIVARL